MANVLDLTPHKTGTITPTDEGVVITWESLTQRDPITLTIDWMYVPLVIESMATLLERHEQASETKKG